MSLREALNGGLHRAEKILKLDVRYTLFGGFYLTLGQVGSAVVGLALTVAFANLLPVETYGTYRYLLAAYSLLAILALPGIDTAVLQSISQGKEGAWGVGIRAKARWGLLATFASLVYAGYLYAHHSPTLALLFVVAALALPFMESLSLYTSFFNARKLFRVWTFIDLGSQVFSALCLITTMFLTKNVVLLVISYFLPYILARLCATVYAYRTYHPNKEIDVGLFSYGRSMTIFQIMSRIIGSADQIVLYHFLGAAQVAIFSLATAVPNRVQSVFRISGTLAFPKFASRSRKEILQTLPRRMALFVLGIMGICLVYVAMAPWIFSHVVPKYLPSLHFSQIAIFYTLSAITYPFSSYLNAHKKVRDNYLIAVGSFIPKILCLIILVPILGVWGAVIGLLATSLATILVTSYIIYRDFREEDIST